MVLTPSCHPHLCPTETRAGGKGSVRERVGVCGALRDSEGEALGLLDSQGLSWGHGDPADLISAVCTTTLGVGVGTADRGRGWQSFSRAEFPQLSHSRALLWGRFPVWWPLPFAGACWHTACTGKSPGETLCFSHPSCSPCATSRPSWAGAWLLEEGSYNQEALEMLGHRQGASCQSQSQALMWVSRPVLWFWPLTRLVLSHLNRSRWQ